MPFKPLHSSILRQYDIRGKVNETLFAEDCHAIGRAFGSIIRRRGLQTAAVGFDGRTTSSSFAGNIIKGLNESGVNVVNVGLGPSPFVYFAMKHLGLDAAVVVTGSHSPLEYNGIKFALKTGPFFGEDVQEIGRVVQAQAFENGQGSTQTADLQDAYVERLLKDYRHKKDLTVAWDNGNGAAGEIIRRLTAKLPGKHILLFDTIDGTFPNHHPDPAVAKNLVDLQKTVKEFGCDIGVAFDGDADRFGAVDENATIWWADALMAVYARYVLQEHPGATVIADVKSSRILFDEIARLGGTPLMSATGHSIIKAKMLELGSPFGGELSGHICFADKYYGFDDGLYCAIRMLDILSNTDAGMSSLFASLPKTESTPEVRFKVDASRKFDIPREIKTRLLNANDPAVQINDTDGIRVTTREGWWLIRASNTEDLLTVRAEAFTVEGLERLKQDIVDQLAESGVSSPF